MLHKLLIFIRYDELNYEDNFYAYLVEEDHLAGVFLADELQDFLGAVIKRSGAQRGDLLDLYLAQDGQCSEDYGFGALFAGAGIGSSPDSSWTDEEAFEIIFRKIMGEKEKVALYGREKEIGTQEGPSVKVYHRLWAAQREDISEDEKNDPDAPVTETGKETGTGKPSLAKLMRKVAEGR